MQRDDGRLWFFATAASVIVFAAAVRFAYLDHSLFEDEVWVASLIREGGLRPHAQATPPLYYLVSRLWSILRGTSDAAMREPAAFFGVLLCALPFFAPLPRLTRLAWSVLLAFSSPLLYYSGRLKQYTLEACAATLLIILFLRAAERDRRRDWLALFAVAALAVVSLHTPILTMAAIGAAALLKPHTRRLPILAGFALVALLAIAAYVGWMAPGPEATQLHGDLEAWFGSTGRFVDSPASFIRNTRHWVGHSLNLTRGAVLLALLLVIGWTVRAREWTTLLVAAIPPTIAALASILHVYPYGEVRLMIFCFPALYLLFSRSLEMFAERVPASILLLVPLALRGVIGAPYESTYMHTPDLRAVYAMVARSSPAETIVADPSFAAPLLYYYPQVAGRTRIAIVGAPSSSGWYLQRPKSFAPSAGSVVLELDGVMAAHSP